MRHRREEVIERAKREYRQLDRLVAKLTRKQWALHVPRPEGKDPWTVKDALAHITHWKANTVRALRKERKPLEERGLQIQQTNHFVYMKWHDATPQEVLAWHRQVQKDVLKALKEAPDAYYAKDYNENWPFDLDGHSVFHRVKDIKKTLNPDG